MSGEGEVPSQKEERLGWEEEVGGAEKSSGGAGTCLPPCAPLLTPCVEGAGSWAHGSSPSRASVSSSVRWVACGPYPVGPVRQKAEGEAFGTSELSAAPFLEHPLGTVGSASHFFSIHCFLSSPFNGLSELEFPGSSRAWAQRGADLCQVTQRHLKALGWTHLR